MTRSDSESYTATPGANPRTRTLKKKRAEVTTTNGGGDTDDNMNYSQNFTSSSSALPPTASSPSIVSSIMRDLVQNTALSNQELKKSLKNSQGPGLNFVTTMPKNLTRFVMRITPLVKLQDEIIEIFMWKNQYRTMVVLLSYILMCMNNKSCVWW